MKETIEWFDYPDVKPEKGGRYLLQTEFGFLAHIDWRDGSFGLPDGVRIIVWAKMPRGASNDK